MRKKITLLKFYNFFFQSLGIDLRTKDQSFTYSEDESLAFQRANLEHISLVEAFQKNSKEQFWGKIFFFSFSFICFLISLAFTLFNYSSLWIFISAFIGFLPILIYLLFKK
jgi:hypothetical protein